MARRQSAYRHDQKRGWAVGSHLAIDTRAFFLDMVFSSERETSLSTNAPSFALNKPAFKTATDEEEEGRRPSSRDLAEVSLTATASGQHERKEKNRERYKKTEENPGSLSHADQKKGNEGVSKYSYVHEEGKNR